MLKRTNQELLTQSLCVGCVGVCVTCAVYFPLVTPNKRK